jgi:phosphonate ABC transporter permease subunit PhnE
MLTNTEGSNRISPLHSVLSVVPGLGQFIGGQRSRGFTILGTFIVLAYLIVWTVAQKARFPDVLLSFDVIFSVRLGPGVAYIGIFWQCLAILLFLQALTYLFSRFIRRDTSGNGVLVGGLMLLYVIVVYISQDSILTTAGNSEELRALFTGTAIFSATALAGFYFWQLIDSGQIGSKQPLRPLTTGLLIGSIAILVLGWNITGINPEKAISEYDDLFILLPKVVWPWRTAFEYEQTAVESKAPIQAPCPPGARGPDVLEPVDGEAWVSVTPTCGEITTRDLARGDLSFGSEISITGGGYTPGAIVEILWQNPIGEAFTPRGVGETDIVIDADGGFETVLYIPEVVIPSTAVGDQIHSLVIREESGEVFTGRMSKEIKLALVGILETIMIGLMATFMGIIFAFPFSFFAARNLMAPIIAPFHRVVGGLIGIAAGLWIAVAATTAVSVRLGGVTESPYQIAASSFVLFFASVAVGNRLGGVAFALIGQRLTAVATQAFSAIGFGTLAGAFGYLLGLLFSRNVVSIPLGAEVAALTEPQYAIGGALLLGGIATAYAWFNALREISIGLAIYTTARTLMNITRSIEPLIWAIIATIWVGLGPFAGTIALLLHTVAALGKLYSESIESIDAGPLEALQATGANRLQTIVYAVIPQVMPPFISFTIYRWDINVRMGTIIGAVGGGGIGFILIQWIRQFDYEAAGLAVWLIAITVATLDYVSARIRERFV